MITALIFVASVAAFFQFFILYCHSILATARTVPLSDRVREIAGVAGEGIVAADFERFFRLIHLCPERDEDRAEIRAVAVYYTLLHAFHWLVRPSIPKIASWVDQECRICTYFAAVALDRRIAYSQGVITQQSSESF